MPEDMVKLSKERSDGDVSCCDGSHYPYGTSLRLNDDLIEDLGVESLSVGDLVEVRGFAVVESKSEHSDQDGSDKNIGLQMTSLKVRREESDRVKQLYGE